MTNSRSSGSRSKLLAVVVAMAAAAAMLGAGGVAHAGGRKRVVVLDFEGPKGEKFHDDLVKLIKKTHTVVPTDKWNGAAEQLDAATLSEKNVKKIARKLKVDAIVEGKIEKRRDSFIIRLKLRAGKSGELIGDRIDTKAEGPRIDGRAQRDLKDELVGAIDNVESNHMSGGDDEDEAPARKTRKAEDDEDDRPVKKARKAEDEEDDRPVRKTRKAEDDEAEAAPAKRSGFSRRSDDERGGDKVDKRAKKAEKTDDDEDKLPAKKLAAKKPEKAEKPDDDKLPPRKAAVKVEDDDKLPPRKTAVKADDDKLPPRKLAARTDDDDKLPPNKAAARKTDKPDDDGKPVKSRTVASRDDDDGNTAEADADTGEPLDAATALSPGERALDAVAGLSATMRRMTFKVSPMLRATPPGYNGTPVAGGMLDATFYPLALGHKRSDQLKNLGLEVLYDRVIKLSSKDPMTGKVYNTTESRFWLAAVFRHAFGRSATAPVVLGSLGYGRQSFNILGTVDIPDVKYSIFAPGVGLRLPLGAKLMLDVDAKLLVITDAGQIQDPDQYGAASVLGFEGALGVDYRITPNIFARAALRAETIGFTFKGTGFQTNQRDGDATTQDISGARDSYFGGIATVGYLY